MAEQPGTLIVFGDQFAEIPDGFCLKDSLTQITALVAGRFCGQVTEELWKLDKPRECICVAARLVYEDRRQVQVVERSVAIPPEADLTEALCWLLSAAAHEILKMPEFTR